MPISEPKWWYGATPTQSLTAQLLRPAAFLYDHATRLRFRLTTPYRAPLPVICIGNFTAGGSGKTPVALALADLVIEEGLRPWFLTRGYGGNATGPVIVDPDIHDARFIGDEPLLLARKAPTVVARKRAEGARLIAAEAAPDSVIIMDDGLQNPSLSKDVALAVVNGRRGIGNGLVIPAGPMRASAAFQAGLVDAVLVSGAGSGREQASMPYLPPAFSALPRYGVEIVPTQQALPLDGSPLIAFAGIADPARFFDLVRACGGHLVRTHSFPDHAFLSPVQARSLLDEARAQSATLITTEKDWVRLGGTSGDTATAVLKAQSLVLPIIAAFDETTRQALQDFIRRLRDTSARGAS